jgi:hypothetical protein
MDTPSIIYVKVVFCFHSKANRKIQSTTFFRILNISRSQFIRIIRERPRSQAAAKIALHMKDDKQ